MKSGWIVIVVLLLAVLLAGGKYVGVRNELVTLQEAKSAAWSQVETQLQRRADLVPNLVALAGARTQQEKIDAHTELGTALSRLLVVVEQYPNLKSDQNFLALQRELAGTENRILVERRKYNEAVQKYNTQIALFPNNIVASMSGFQRDDAYFKTEPGARQAPKVDFSK
jgi:LemA protein